MVRISALCLLTLAFVGCGPPRRPPVDSGVEDAGLEDAGVDAGRVRGDDPPNGFSVVTELDAGAASTTRVGASVASAPDQFGQPLVASIYEDPNGDGTYDDNRVVFTRWDGTIKAFTTPVTIEVIGGSVSQVPHRQVAIARDSSTGRIAVLYVKPQTNTARLAVTDDEGLNFSLSTVSLEPSAAAIFDPQVVLANGSAWVAWVQGSSLVYKTRVGAAAFVEASPSFTVLPYPISLALDSAGNPGVAFFVGTATLNAAELHFWRPGSSTTTPIASSNDVDVSVIDRRPSVALTFDQTTPAVAYHLRTVIPSVTADATTELWFAKASDAAGTSWAPVGISRNGDSLKFHSTQWFQALVIDQGKYAIAANFQANGTPTNCQGPKLIRSSDGVSFMTCAPTGTPLQTAGDWVSLWPRAAGKLSMVFAYEDTRANPQLKPGIVMWREP